MPFHPRLQLVTAGLPAGSADRTAGEASDAMGSRRVLVADDNRDAAQSLAELLRLCGHEVAVAHDGLEALALAERLRPEVALLDLGMPRLNGYDACRRLRAEPWGRGTVLVAVTGWGQDEDRRATDEAGFDHHLVKPVDPAALLRLLEG